MISWMDITEDWRMEGSFQDPDGKSVRPYDDVVVSRPIEIAGGWLRDKVTETLPAGSIGTVLMFTAGPEGWTHLEMYRPESVGGFGFSYEKIEFLRLHMTNEEKYPR